MAATLPGVRERFPGLAGGWARLDGPAGTQMLDTAIEAVADFMRSGDNANHGGVFRAAEATDELTHAAREAVGRFLGGTPDTVAFGPSMTALTMRFSAAVGRTLQPGDEIVCTRLDHDANVAPGSSRPSARARRSASPTPSPRRSSCPRVRSMPSSRTVPAGSP